MFCENCGKEIADDSLFCSHCGASVGNQNQGPKVRTQEVEVYVDEVDEEIARRKKSIPLYVVLIVLGGIFGLQGFWVKALRLGIMSFSIFGFITVILTTPALLLAIWGIIGICLAGNRKIAQDTVERRKREAENKRHSR